MLKDNSDLIIEKLKNMDISIPEESKSPSFDERVQTSSDGLSYAERTMYQIIDRLEKELADNNNMVEKLKELIRKINQDNKIRDENIKWLGNKQLKYFQFKYKDKLRNWEIANNLNVMQLLVPG